ncbi:hypothetical protein [Candidatus Berkiella aquae]|uniref:Uncharacterized protein n=1 Tax=Candidatus Berkiella aquae TaxID=295108 RepID=A0A0Q9YVP4_9GAMM|nr:hypothetical protein [Candidatus Berkiella aquae]MCS5711508.1 hypothetical protein [Candidatus Berkiella aquae]
MLHSPTRTRRAIDFHRDDRGLPGYIYQTVDGKLWNWVRTEVDFANESETLWVSMGSSAARENLLLDTNSPRIIQLREQVINETVGKPVKEVLTIVNNIVDELTAIAGKSRHAREHELDDELSLFLLTKPIPRDITIDELIEKKLLVCRHKALLSAYLIGDLIKMGILPKGKAIHYRCDLNSGSARSPRIHTWSLYLQSGHSWICDPRWQLVLDLNNGSELKTAAYQYGFSTIEKMLETLLQNKKKPATDIPFVPKAEPAPVKLDPMFFKRQVFTPGIFSPIAQVPAPSIPQAAPIDPMCLMMQKYSAMQQSSPYASPYHSPLPAVKPVARPPVLPMEAMAARDGINAYLRAIGAVPSVQGPQSPMPEFLKPRRP